MSALAILVALCQLALWILLATLALRLFVLAARGWGWPLAGTPDALPPDSELPVVTVQLPMRNELGVAERALRAACALDWPGDRLDVQVLDDSDDETAALVDRVALELRAAGHSVEVVRRAGRHGFKAGALAGGLGTARGDYLLVLDADAVPPPDLVRRLMAPLLADPAVGFTQARWSFENEEAGLLTRVQALILDGLMLIEQPLLSARGLPMQFNGTGGVWRRAALDAAGGWLGTATEASVTEDLDLFYRAQLAGYRGLHLADVAVATELPATMAAFRAQQTRWVRGAGQVLRGLVQRINRGATPRERLAMLAHLARHARQPLLLAAVVWLPAVVLGVLDPPCTPRGVWPVLLLVVMLAMGAYYGAARRRRGRAALPALVLAPAIVALSMGMSLLLTVAFVGGLARPSGTEFVRTPKGRAYRAPFDALALLEVAIGVTYLALAAVLLARGQWPTALALGAFVGGGFLWVGGGSLFA